VFKVTLLVLVAMSIPIAAFAEPMIELSSSQTEVHALDTVLVVGKITGVSEFKPVTLTVIAPDGEIIYTPQLSFDNDGVFKRLIHAPLPSFKQGVYTVIASHEDTEKTAQIQFTVTGATITPTVPPTKSTEPGMTEKPSVIALSVESKYGYHEITVTGSTRSSSTDITFTITSPKGNLISVGQVTPDVNGKFSTKINAGGPLWKEDGLYTITANQGLTSELKQSVQVEISNGVVIPEFGSIAVMILAAAIISIIAISSKSRLTIIPRY